MSTGPDLALPPHATEAEQALLGSILIDPDCLATLPGLTVADFYVPKHRTLYRAVEAVAARGDPADITMVLEELTRRGERQDIPDSYLAQLMSAVPTSMHAPHYLGIVQRMATFRRLIQASGAIAQLAYDAPADVETAITQAEALVAAVAPKERRGGLTPIGIPLAAYLASTLADVPLAGRIPTGYYDLDRILGGLGAGDLVILAARPGLGKSALALGIARHVAVALGGTVALFSLEMGAPQLAERVIALESGIDATRLRTGQLQAEEAGAVLQAATTLAGVALYVDDAARLTLADIRSRTRALHAEQAVSLVIVDYLQLIAAAGRSRVEEVGEISRGLKALARELACPVLALSQLNRQVEGRAEHTPRLSDLREAGDLEQDADIVLFISREDQYDKDSERKGIADILVAKDRNGPVGQCELYFQAEAVRFLNLGVIDD